MELELTCNKCPYIEGQTWCSFKKKKIWKSDDMCEQGYFVRIDKGIKMCGELSKRKGNEEKIKRMDNRTKELERIWEKKFKKKEVIPF